jgi:hypothetical protein
MNWHLGQAEQSGYLESRVVEDWDGSTDYVDYRDLARDIGVQDREISHWRGSGLVGLEHIS